MRLQDVLTREEDNYMLPFFWQHGENPDTLREYMQVIHNANIGAVCVESRPHPDFLGDQWWMDMDVILDEAKRLKMKVWILDDSHFPSGYANGAMRNAPKELHHKYMCYRTLEMAGPVKQVEFEWKQYMQPCPPPPFMPASPKRDDTYEDDERLKILACPVLDKGELGEPIDLTDHIQGDRVIFDLPDGYYRIYVIYISRNGKGRNDYINFMDRDSCRILIDTVYEKHYEHYKKYFGNVIEGFFSDEPPIGNVDGYMAVGPIGEGERDLPWSAEAAERLAEEYGSEAWKDVVPYLWAPAADKEQQAKIRNAYMEMVTKLVEECFSKQTGKWCEEHGVAYIGHMLEDCDMNMSLGPSMGHFFRGLSGQHMAGVDNIGGQVTINGQNVPRHSQPACQDEAGFYQYVIGKLGASHAAIDPKKKGRTLCENFGAYGWQSGPGEQKFMMDHFLVRGVNRYVPHAFSPAPFPDPDCPPHFYAHGENPTFGAFGELMAYSNRVCHLIDGGTPCPDVAVLYAAEGIWSGDGGSNIPVCRHLTQAQVDFHIIPSDVFDESREYPCTFDGKRLTVNQVSYAALVISKCSFVDEKTAGFIEKAVKAGFPVIFTDHKPHGIVKASTEKNDIFANTIESCACVPVDRIGSYIKMDSGIPLHTKAAPDNKMLTTYHYQLEGRDEYLILNEMADGVYTGELTVKANGIPVRYLPWENRLEKIDYEKPEAEIVKLKVSIDPLELCVIVFLKDQAEWKKLNDICGIRENGCRMNQRVMVEQLTRFQVRRGDSQTVDTVEAPFTGMQQYDPDYSGFYHYESKVSLKRGPSYQLVIEDVYASAEVFMNGQSLGTRIQRPYQYEIPASLVRPENEIQIVVATLLERKVKAMGADISAMSPERPLSPTGIVGNVIIYAASPQMAE